MKTVKDLEGIWTRFNDMSSGGTQKTDWSIIFIQADVENATKYLNFKYEVHPDAVTCCCCGEDFAIATGRASDIFSRGFITWKEQMWSQDRELYKETVKAGDDWTYLVTREQVLERVIAHVNEPDERNVLIVFADEMGDEWRDHYVWEPYNDCYENDEWS
jgi:hypothetical protein